MLRSLPRATPSSSILGGLSIRSSLRRPIQSRIPLCAFEAQNQQQHQKRHTTTAEVFANPSLTRISGFAALKQQKRHSTAPAHAVSNPMLAGIEKRWEVMPPQEQAELWMALRDRMKNDWHELTLQERKACEFSPRRCPLPSALMKFYSCVFRRHLLASKGPSLQCHSKVSPHPQYGEDKPSMMTEKLTMVW